MDFHFWEDEIDYIFLIPHPSTTKNSANYAHTHTYTHEDSERWRREGRMISNFRTQRTAWFFEVPTFSFCFIYPRIGAGDRNLDMPVQRPKTSTSNILSAPLSLSSHSWISIMHMSVCMMQSYKSLRLSSVFFILCFFLFL